MKQFNLQKKNESGAALVVALILVLVSTLMGVSAMQVSDVENQLVNNTKYRQVTFRAAEAAGEQLFTMPNLITLANDFSATVESTNSIDPKVTVSASLQPFGEGPATGYSLGGQNGFSSLKFASNATATLPAVDSSSTVVQGVQRLTLASER
ncbi:MAG: PilX N-terminal domain-containing pilus assembly protein [Granulosicoccus sp.]